MGGGEPNCKIDPLNHRRNFRNTPMEREGPERRLQQRCAKNVSMTCSHINQNDDHNVTVRNYSSRGMYFESDEAASIGSFIVLRATGAHDMQSLASPSDQPFPFSMGNSDSQACRGYRSHTVAKVIRCKKIFEEATRFGIGAEVMILSD
jgi:hypothetical protein